MSEDKRATSEKVDQPETPSGAINAADADLPPLESSSAQEGDADYAGGRATLDEGTEGARTRPTEGHGSDAAKASDGPVNAD